MSASLTKRRPAWSWDLPSPSLEGAVPVALGSGAPLGGSVGFWPSPALAGAASVALGSGAALGGSAGFWPSPPLTGVAPVALGSGAVLGGSAGFCSPMAPAGGGVSGTGARNEPISGLSFLFAIMCSSSFQIMSKNASQLETHFQPILGAKIVLNRRLIVIIDGRWGVV